MKNIIELDNDYYLEIADNELNIDAKDIEKLNIRKITKQQFLLKIDFNKFDRVQYKKILRKLLFIRKTKIKDNSKIGIQKDTKILLGYVLNYDENNKDHKDFILGINAVFYNNRFDRYNYIYDAACEHLDSFFYGKNLCDFKNDRCRNGEAKTLTGCCGHFRVKWLGPITKNVICEHLGKNGHCEAKCIACKLFTCDYLQKKGIKFEIKDILLLDVFFNPLQKYFIKHKTFTPKEKILKLLMIT